MLDSGYREPVQTGGHTKTCIPDRSSPISVGKQCLPLLLYEFDAMRLTPRKGVETMRRFVPLTMAVLAALTLLSSVALAQSAPQFKLGFKALADQIPDVVGTPLEEEHWGANGDSLQQTSKGLMAWRKADNWTAFTNGSRTWVNGPFGVMERANEERFEWEAAAPATPSAPQPPAAPQPTQAPAPQPTQAPAPQPTAAPTQAPAPPAPTQAPAAPTLIDKDKASSAILRLPDMATGYETISLGWAQDGYLEAKFHTTGRNYRSGPLITARILLFESEPAAQAALDRVSWSGFSVLGAAMTNVSSAKAFSKPFQLQDSGEQGAEYAVFFRVKNAVAFVDTYGFYSNTTMDLTLRLAQLMANRLTAP